MYYVCIFRLYHTKSSCCACISITSTSLDSKHQLLEAPAPTGRVYVRTIRWGHGVGFFAWRLLWKDRAEKCKLPLQDGSGFVFSVGMCFKL